MGDALEDGHEDQSAHTEEEDGLALAGGEQAGLEAECLVLGEREFAFQREAEDVCGNDHRHERGDEYFGDDAGSRDDALVPEHDGRDVSDGRECASRVGCDDDERGIDDAVALVADELSQNHDHHDGCGEIVEDGREDERHEGDAPQQFLLAARLQRVAHEVESAVLVDEFHNRHRSHEEEERGGCGSEVAFNLCADDQCFGFAYGSGQILCRVDHEDGPANYEHQQRDGCLIHFRHALDGNAEIANDEGNDNQKG